MPKSEISSSRIRARKVGVEELCADSWTRIHRARGKDAQNPATVRVRGQAITRGGWPVHKALGEPTAIYMCWRHTEGDG